MAFAFQTADAQITALNQNRSHFISGKSGIGGGYSDRGELVQQNSNGGNINNGISYSWRYYNTGNTGIQEIMLKLSGSTMMETLILPDILQGGKKADLQNTFKQKTNGLIILI